MIKSILKIIGLIFIAPWVCGILLLIGWSSLFIFLFGLALLLIFTGYVGNEWLLCEYSTK